MKTVARAAAAIGVTAATYFGCEELSVQTHPVPKIVTPAQAESCADDLDANVHHYQRQESLPGDCAEIPGFFWSMRSVTGEYAYTIPSAERFRALIPYMVFSNGQARYEQLKENKNVATSIALVIGSFFIAVSVPRRRVKRAPNAPAQVSIHS